MKKQPTPPALDSDTDTTDEATAAQAAEYRSDYPQISYPEAPRGPIQFVAGSFSTSDPDEIAYLDSVESAERA